MKLMKTGAALGVLVLIGMTSTAQAGISSTLILDDFDSDPNDDAGGPGVYSTVVFNNPFNQSAEFTLDTLLSSGSDTGAVIFNSGIGVEQGASIRYDNNGSGLNLNAAALGITGFEMDYLDVDQGFVMNIELSNNGDGPSGMAGVATLAVFIPAGMNQTASWSLGDFIISPGFDIQDVDTVTVNFNLEDNATASLDFIATEFRAVVPAPGPIALLALGGIVAVSRRRV